MKIKLYNDIAFKWIFGRQEHTGPLISLLNAVVGSPDQFCEVQILNPFDISEPFKNEKQGILDIRGKDTLSNEWFDLEVQVIESEYYPQRSKYYLAGLYRDQLEKSGNMNYDKLTPCYGIHILVDTLFKSEEDKEHWFNHYAMLNTRNYKPLANHWHLYYIELKKFLSCLKKRVKVETELEEWSYFLGTVQDNSRPIDPRVSSNKAIKEVYEMLKTFTNEDRLREQYRLHEEFLRVQRTEQTRTENFRQQALLALQAQEKEKAEKEAALKDKEKEKAEKEAALKDKEKEKAEKEAALKDKEKEKAEKEAALKDKEKEKAEKEAALKDKEKASHEIRSIKEKSILFMKKQGNSKEEISEILNIPIEEIEQFF